MRIVELRTVACVLALAACRGEDPAAPAPQGPPLFQALVSNPVSGGGGPGATTSGTNLVYVSLSPGTIPEGLTVAVDNVRTNERVTANVLEGGFDPIPIAAEVRDTLSVAVVVAGGDRKEARFAVPPGRRLLVVRTDPPPGRRDVPLNSNLLVVFSEPVDPGSLVEGSIVLRRGTEIIPIGLELDAEKPWIVRVAPSGRLAPSTTYSLTLTSMLRDRDGESPGVESTVEFTTQDAATLLDDAVIAFESTRDVGPGPGGTPNAPWIYLADADGNVLSRPVRGYAPAWSPDGRQIAFHRWSGITVGEGGLELAVVNIDGTGLTVVTTGGGWPSWSPDGSTIVYSSGVGIGEVGIYSIRLGDAASKRKLTAYDDYPPIGYGPGWVGYPTYSPDGRTISFVRAVDGGPWLLYLMSPDGTNARELLVGSSISPPRWSPDGSRLLVTHVHNYDYIASVTLDGTLSDAYAQDAVDPEWSPDGLQILYTRLTGAPTQDRPYGSRMRVFIQPIPGGTPRQLIPDATNAVSPDYWDQHPVWRRR